MPTYDYRCRECGTTLEVIHGMTEDGPSVCEVCGGPMRRVLFPTGIIFKGSGFYRNDSRAGSTVSGGSKAPATPTGGTTAGTGSTDGAASSGSAGGTDAPASTPTPSPATEG